MYINGKLTIFTKEVTKKDGSKTILLNQKAECAQIHILQYGNNKYFYLL